MKNIKDITISIFAIIGFMAILSSFNNQTQQEVHGTPESHAWDMIGMEDDNSYIAYSFNKITGEVRKYNSESVYARDDGTLSDSDDVNKYAVMIEAKE